MKKRVSDSIYVGWDWATETHQVCVMNAAGKVLKEFSAKHSGEGLAEACDRLAACVGSDGVEIRAAIETSHGAVVETLMGRGILVHAINPKQLDRFRDRHTVAGAKDDRRDAFVLADSLRTDGHLYRRLTPEDSNVVELREWSRMLEELTAEYVRLSNRTRQQLLRFYPQALELENDVGKEWFLELLELAPTPTKAKRIRKATVDKLLKAHRIRRIDGPAALAILRQKAIKVSPGTIDAATAHIRQLADRLRVVNAQRAECRERIDQLLGSVGEAGGDEAPAGEGGEPRDVEILRSLPGVGRIVLATLLAEASRPLRARDYQGLRSLAGIAPVTRASGKRQVVVMRRACHRRLRNACYHWGMTAVQCDPWAGAVYATLKQRGKSHGTALRSVVDRLLRVAVSMLRNGETYDPARRQAAA